MYLPTLSKFIFHEFHWFFIKFVQTFTTEKVVQQGSSPTRLSGQQSTLSWFEFFMLLMPLPVGRVVNSPGERTAHTLEPFAKPLGRELYLNPLVYPLQPKDVSC